MKAPIADVADFAALEPFFRIIEQGLDGLVEPGQRSSTPRAATIVITTDIQPPKVIRTTTMNSSRTVAHPEK